MEKLLSFDVLNEIKRTLLGADATLRLYAVTPTEGEKLIATLRAGWGCWREARGRGESNVTFAKLAISSNASLTNEQLQTSAVATITANRQTIRYSISEVLPMQQLGVGWILRLEPLTV